MSPLRSPIELSGAEKLEILQRLDRFRKWQSLGDQRYCLTCGEVIDGHSILVVGGARGTGPLRLICPTNCCHSIPMDWVIPNDEVLARVSEFREQQSQAPKKTPVKSHERFGDRLRKFAMQFRPAA